MYAVFQGQAGVLLPLTQYTCPSLYDCMSNQKIAPLLHLIRANKSFSFDIIGKVIASMCCVSSTCMCKK